MLSRRTWLTAAGATTLAASTLALTALPQKALARGRVELPSHEVVASFDTFEVRRYAPRLIAEVTVKGSGKDASNAGFRILAGFIFGNNTASREVAMTAPVERASAASAEIAMTAPVERTASSNSGSGSGSQTWIVAFTMPSKYTLETLPKPNDSRVRIRELPAQLCAVSRFSGAPGEAAVQRKMDALTAAVAAEGLTRDGGPPTYARYDPPWTPGVLRRNEITVGLNPKQ